jgi:hypothetical protein
LYSAINAAVQGRVNWLSEDEGGRYGAVLWSVVFHVGCTRFGGRQGAEVATSQLMLLMGDLNAITGNNNVKGSFGTIDDAICRSAN